MGNFVFKPDTNIDLCQISLTGARAIALIGLLTDEPRSLEEIREAFIEYNLMDEDNSNDIIRIDINTLRAMGCEITRADGKSGHKFKLLRHPYELNIESNEIKLIKRIYKKLRDEFDINELIKYDNLFRKIAQYVGDPEIKEQMLGLSVLNKYNSDLVNRLIEDSKSKKVLTLVYKSPNSSTSSKKKIALKEVVYKNDKLYLYGFDTEKQVAVTLNIDRIVEFLSCDENNKEIEIEPTKVKFHLKDFGVNGLEDYEHIISYDESGYTIQGDYHNDFVAIQRILSFGANCTVIAPNDFKNKVIKKLKSMKEVYNG